MKIIQPQTSRYKGQYYDHYSGDVSGVPPIFSKEANYLMRFETPLSHYRFDENGLTVIYFKKGAGKLCWDDKRYSITSDKFIVTNPSMGWNYWNERGDEIDVMSYVISKNYQREFCYFNRATIEKLLDQPFERYDIDRFFIESPLSANLFRSGQLLQKMHAFSQQEDYVYSNANELTIELLNSLYADQVKGNLLADRIEAKKSSTRLETIRRLLIVRDFIHDNIDSTEKLGIDLLAQIGSLSKFHIYTSFKAVFGFTPHQYVNLVRLNRVKKALKTTRLPIHEIAYENGFNDQAAFSKLFKKHTHISPSQYRQKFKF